MQAAFRRTTMTQPDEQIEERDEAIDAREVFAAVAELARDERAFKGALEAFAKHDAEGFRSALEDAGLLGRCHLVCRWLCVWHCHLVCLRLCGPHDAEKVPHVDPLAVARAVVRLTEDEEGLHQLVDAVERDAADDFRAILGKHDLLPLLHVICFWICEERCRLFCRRVCEAGPRPDLFEALREAGGVLAVALQQPRRVAEGFAAYERGDLLKLQEDLKYLHEGLRCWLVCRWYCFLHCWRRCFVVCRPVPIPIPVPPPWPELREHFIGLVALAREETFGQLRDAFERDDGRLFHRIVESSGLGWYCFVICRMVCEGWCERICHLVCIPSRLVPLFTHIGVYDYSADISSTTTGTGLTNSDSRAFYGNIRLHGVLTQTLGGQPMEYRFEVQIGGGAWKPVPLSAIAPTGIGYRQVMLGGILWNFAAVVNGSPSLFTTVVPATSDGWISVPQGANFSLNGDMIRLITSKVFPAPPIDITGITAGQSTASAGLGTDMVVGIRMMVRKQGTTGNGTPAGTCARLAVYNRHYDNVTHGGSWAPTIDSNELAPAMADIDEIGSGCSVITDKLTPRYTVAHPNLAGISLRMTGPGGPYTFTLSPDGGATAVNAFGFAIPDFAVADLEPCAYLVTLRADLLLTDGDNFAGSVGDQVAFCKH
jgi:hypothetical protein